MFKKNRVSLGEGQKCTNIANIEDYLVVAKEQG